MNNYTIITLGPSGSGKTIFLASLFKVFSIQGKFGFSLDVLDHSKRRALNKIYADLTTGEDWPSGTRNLSEWVFTAYVNNSGASKIPACTITYADYKGGLITDELEDEKDYNNLSSYMKEADAILVILDGQKLLSFRRDPDLTNDLTQKLVYRWLNQDLPNLMQMVAECNKSTPVHFIISKWDLLQEGKYSLADVKELLLKNVSEFKKVVENRKKAGCPVRLIPVSSLGKGFAALQPNGQMKKLSVNPHPMNVEFPLVFALTDKRKNQTGGLKQKPSKLTVWDWVVIGVCIVLISIYGLGLLIAIVYFGFRLLMKNSKQRSSETLSSEDSFEQILSKCQGIQKEFNAKFPDSDLAKTPFFKFW